MLSRNRFELCFRLCFEHAPFIGCEFTFDAEAGLFERGSDTGNVGGFEAAEDGSAIGFQDSPPLGREIGDPGWADVGYYDIGEVGWVGFDWISRECDFDSCLLEILAGYGYGFGIVVCGVDFGSSEFDGSFGEDS